MKIILAIGIGSFLGGILRYIIFQIIRSKSNSDFPWETLGVNLIGCFLIGLVFGLSVKTNMPEAWKLFLATGLIGGFTTFSAFSIETVNLIKNDQLLYASTYIGSSVLFGLAATIAGIYLIRLIF